MQPNRTATDYPAESVFPKFAPRTSTHFFMLSRRWVLGSNGAENRSKEPSGFLTTFTIQGVPRVNQSNENHR